MVDLPANTGDWQTEKHLVVDEKNVGGRPKKFQSVDEIDFVIDSYFTDCVNRQVPFTMSGLSLSLGIDRKTLLNYSKRPGDERFFPSVKRARERVQRFAEERLFGTAQVAGAIFALKNNHDWKDKSESLITMKPPVFVDDLSAVDVEFEVLDKPEN